MPAIGMRILEVGKLSRGTQSILSRLASSGWGSRMAETLREAEVLMRTFRFDLVLATESLPDGPAYAITGLVAELRGTLMVAIALSESCLWLPVVELGARVLGTRALRPEQLEQEAQNILRARDQEQLRVLPTSNSFSARAAPAPRAAKAPPPETARACSAAPSGHPPRTNGARLVFVGARYIVPGAHAWLPVRHPPRRISLD